MAPEVRDGSYVDKDSMKTGRKSRKNLYLNLKPSDIWCVGLILFEMVTLIPVWELKFDITLKLISDPDEVWKLVDDLTYYDSQVTSIIKKCLKIDAKDRPTIHQILKGKFVKKHLKYLEKNKKKYKKNESMKLLEEGQIWSRQASSDDSYFGSDNNDESDISVYLEDQGSLLEPKNPRKQTRRRKKNKKKRSR
uniref:Protein kinase domain-containing protein n=1 Tax=Euplotes crassus TaxID=5936 RepID=A0A7S3KHY7_EUPCR|mmetsp:Transcript_25479/g.25264  ORF Transcript_25479/g.25264 Transcript_25479/m.25264 type:complete len:193 (+) Transcript_25479:1029-1607(+)|eukprot:CAMPEP_0197011852 /NCGR_PEP_ID=MMETSP1380-20130617/60289_1 /TAXON_ID=5936 /ORGANISM="Euplotes crassus, Strain CT5" /LENGTH=192 /DNA_ID=CAMNT_0042434911 /DNA_START=1029 /DNA_END=1607 /DNA_ORIENTATION=-